MDGIWFLLNKAGEGLRDLEATVAELQRQIEEKDAQIAVLADQCETLAKAVKS